MFFFGNGYLIFLLIFTPANARCSVPLGDIFSDTAYMQAYKDGCWLASRYRPVKKHAGTTRRRSCKCLQSKLNQHHFPKSPSCFFIQYPVCKRVVVCAGKGRRWMKGHDHEMATMTMSSSSEMIVITDGVDGRYRKSLEWQTENNGRWNHLGRPQTVVVMMMEFIFKARSVPGKT